MRRCRCLCIPPPCGCGGGWGGVIFLLFRQNVFFVSTIFFDFECFLFDLLDGISFGLLNMCPGPAHWYLDSFSDNILLDDSLNQIAIK